MTRHPIFVLVLLLTALSGFAQSPQFKGGQDALDAFLQEHIVYPEYSRKNCIDAVIKVNFTIDKNGIITDVKAVDGPGIDLDDEAVRVVKMTAGKWMPAPGVPQATLTLPIRFTPDHTRCVGATDESKEKAILAYLSRQGLEDAVTDYYKDKYAGKADTSKEDYIISLKKELGFDDELIEDILQQADKKLKQGDREGACTDWTFIRNIGSNRADQFLTKYCK